MIENKQVHDEKTDTFVSVEIETLLALSLANSLVIAILRDVEQTIKNIVKGIKEND